MRDKTPGSGRPRITRRKVIKVEEVDEVVLEEPFAAAADESLASMAEQVGTDIGLHDILDKALAYRPRINVTPPRAPAPRERPVVDLEVPRRDPDSGDKPHKGDLARALIVLLAFIA